MKNNMLFENNPELSGGPLGQNIYEKYRHEVEGEDFCEEFYTKSWELLEGINSFAETNGLLVTGDHVDLVEGIGEKDRKGIEGIGDNKVMPSHFPAGATLQRTDEKYLFRFASRSERGRTSHFLQLYNADFPPDDIVPDYVRGEKAVVVSSFLVAKETEEYCEATEYILKNNSVLKMIVRHIDMYGTTSTFVSSNDNAKTFAIFSLGDAYCELIGD